MRPGDNSPMWTSTPRTEQVEADGDSWGLSEMRNIWERKNKQGGETPGVA